MNSKARLTVVKIGGNIIDHQPVLDRFLAQFAALEGYKILVHGGGQTASKMAAALGVTSTFQDGRRITSGAMLDVAVMTYAGLVNKRITVQLQAMHANAIGVTGADGNLILSKKRMAGTVDYGFVGDVTAVNTSLLTTWLHQQIIPVFSAITHDGNGQLLNTNADSIASSIATALSTFFEVSLVYCFEKNGLLNDMSNEDSVVAVLTPATYDLLRGNGTIHSGMIPKLDNCFTALSHGVADIRIGGPEVLASHNMTFTRIQNTDDET